MLGKFQKVIQKKHPFLLEAKLLVACSGGLDSVVLATLLKEMGIEIGLAHANFQLRGEESDEDESFVLDLAEKWQVPVFTERFDTQEFADSQKLSVQMAARELRYRWFDEIMNDFKFDYLVTAHHADDDLETFLINLSRGTGLQGLLGIPAQNGKVVRPLLSFDREAILAYAKKENLFWREDSSNAKRDYLRNQLRHEVIPELKQASGTFLHNFQKTQQYLRDSGALVADYVALVSNLVFQQTEQGWELDLEKIKDLPNQNALLFELLRPFGFSAWEDIHSLPKAQSGKQIVSKTHRSLKDRGVLLVTEIPSKGPPKSKFIQKGEGLIDHPLKMSFIPTDKMGYVDSKVVYVDQALLEYPLELRKWQKGDVFHPFGMKGKKKLSKFFKDEKLSLATKETVWVLLSGGIVVWVIGYRPDDRFKVTSKTKNILKISFAG